MQFTKEIFDILSRGGFISQNSVDATVSHYYDLLEDNLDEYRNYYEGIGFLLEGGNGYFYFSRQESKKDLADKVQRFVAWIDIVDFLKVYNSTFAPGFTFRRSNIMERFSTDIELKEKARGLYAEEKSLDGKVDRLVSELDRMGFIELENEMDGTYRVTAAFHYIEEMMDCITIVETEEDEK